MKTILFTPMTALLLLAACRNAQRVERPMDDVHGTLASIPADADAMELATTYPGTDYLLEQDGGRLIWHFRHNGQDYGRFVATLKEDGPAATKVSTRFENADDAELADKLGFLRDVARITAEASVAAALSGRAVDRAALQQQIGTQMVQDPTGAYTAAVEMIRSDLDREIEERKRREAEREPIYPKPGVYPKVGGKGGPRDDPRRGSETWVE